MKYHVVTPCSKYMIWLKQQA